MTKQQAHNVIVLCKGNSEPKIRQLFQMVRYTDDDVAMLAEELKCDNNRDTVIKKLATT